MKRTIALVTGGYSREAEISYRSASTISSNMDHAKFDCYTIDIHPGGWDCIGENGRRIPVDKSDFSITFDNTKVKFDLALICIHGTPGEDGKLQAYFDMLALPYTSCDSATSSLTFNKRHAVAVAAFGGIRVARSIHIFKHSPVSPATILHQLQLPLFVKPNNGGSSIGMSKVNEARFLQPAIDMAFREDDQLLVEEFIGGREFKKLLLRRQKNIF
jgi:D-alanine-D-alanine ligase